MGEELGLGDDADIDALCELLDQPAGGAESPRSDVDALLGCLAPGGGPDLPLAAKHRGAASEALSDRPSEALEPDLPEPTVALPSNVVPVPFLVLAKFHLKCEVDLKQVAFGIRNAEYNPRKHSSITIRLFGPRTTALVRQSGVCSITGKVTEEELKSSAKKVARLVQRCGYQEQVRFADYHVTSLLCQADLHFPVRLDLLASRWRRNALYEPEFFSNCVFRCRQPKVTYLVTAGGKVMVSGLRKLEDVKEALRRAYGVFVEFQK